MGYVPVSEEELAARLGAVESAARRLDRAVGAGVELTDDLRVDAARFMAARGATEAQIARLEDAVGRHREAVQQARRALDEAIAGLRALVAE